ncbi:LexA family protein [Streptomyces albireticuli]|uniref:LexA family protein n=1 Tax=Streptomyces albireticuli TaxID=1940 RepID=UPI0036C0CC69
MSTPKSAIYALQLMAMEPFTFPMTWCRRSATGTPPTKPLPHRTRTAPPRCAAEYVRTRRRGRRDVAERLSPRQEAIVWVIQEWITEHGEGPSVRETGERVGLSSTGSVAYHLDRLEERGLISRGGWRWRSCRPRG